MRILVTEDDAALGSFVKKGLQSEHYAVDVSTDGKEVCAMAGELDFDLAVLDSTCRGWMAWPSCAFCAPGSPSMPILVLTGCTRVVDRVLCLDLGADDYLGKPVLAVDDQKLDRVERGWSGPSAGNGLEPARSASQGATTGRGAQYPALQPGTRSQRS